MSYSDLNRSGDANHCGGTSCGHFPQLHVGNVQQPACQQVLRVRLAACREFADRAFRTALFRRECPSPQSGRCTSSAVMREQFCCSPKRK